MSEQRTVTRDERVIDRQPTPSESVSTTRIAQPYGHPDEEAGGAAAGAVGGAVVGTVVGGPVGTVVGGAIGAVAGATAGLADQGSKETVVEERTSRTP